MTNIPIEIAVYPTSHPYIWVWYGADHILLRNSKFFLRWRIARAARKLKKRRTMRAYIAGYNA